MNDDNDYQARLYMEHMTQGEALLARFRAESWEYFRRSAAATEIGVGAGAGTVRASKVSRDDF